MKKSRIATVGLLAIASFSSCIAKKNDGEGSSKLLKMDTKISEDLTSKLASPEDLCGYLSEEKYVVGNDVKPGSTVAFSTSYGVDTQSSGEKEAGQAYGDVTSDGFFNQKDMTTNQLLVCPGAFSINGGKCNWKLSGPDGYAELAHRVVCNTAATYGSRGRLHPGYSSMKVSKASFKASTAGKSFGYNDVIEVALKGGESGAFVYFAKGVGLVATEFRENTMPSGTAKVYIGSSPDTTTEE